jgi:uncharacterized RDD family membrane protein YckC
VCRACGGFLPRPEAGRVATAGQRLGAYLLEGVISFALCFVLGFSAGLMSGSEDTLIGAAVLGAAIYWALNLYFWTRGQTLGKAVLGMRVYKVTGEPAGFGTMLLREVVGKSISGLVISLGFLWIIWDREHQGWHDRIAGTLVLKK